MNSIWTFRLAWLFRLILAGVFIYAGVLKMLDPSGFAGSIATFQLVPESWSNVIALTLPPFEILAGVAILLPWSAQVGAWSIAGLNVVFLVGLVQGLIRGLPVDCGCFGSSGPSSTLSIALAIGRDVVLLILAIVVYVWATSGKDVEETCGTIVGSNPEGRVR